MSGIDGVDKENIATYNIAEINSDLSALKEDLTILKINEYTSYKEALVNFTDKDRV